MQSMSKVDLAMFISRTALRGFFLTPQNPAVDLCLRLYYESSHKAEHYTICYGQTAIIHMRYSNCIEVLRFCFNKKDIHTSTALQTFYGNQCVEADKYSTCIMCNYIQHEDQTVLIAS